MQFADVISFPVFNDAWETFNTYFNPGKRIAMGDFYQAARSGEYVKLTIAQSLRSPPDNMSSARLTATSAAGAYPPGDRPRGAADLKSVAYHVRSKCASPIVFVKGADGRLTLLDGMHRVVAAKVSGRRTVVALIITV